MEIHSHWSDITPYKMGIELQKKAFAKLQSEVGVHVIGMEHPEVLTLGLRSHKDPKISIYEKQFKEVVKIRRGGHLVIHNPGQLVIYPVLSLKNNNLSIRDYVCLLVKSTKALLKKYDILSFEKEEPGLFTDTGKIAMFGVGVNQGITQHGLCLNVSNDLSVFSRIALCDVQSESLDSLEKHSIQRPLQALFEEWCEEFKRLLSSSQTSCNN